MDYDEDSEGSAARPVKRRRTSKGKRTAQNRNPHGYHGRNIGKLLKLLEMPVDIFYEICTHLEPIDLLHLARSTKSLNQMLMSRESRPLWRAARQHYPDLPDCPPDLSEPEYAKLLFEKDCDVCRAPRVLKVDFLMRARVCHRCRRNQITKGSQLLMEIPGLTEELLECIPCRLSHASLAKTRRRKLEFFCRYRVERFVAKFKALVPADPDVPLTGVQMTKGRFYEYHKGLLPVIFNNAIDVANWIRRQSMSKRESNMEISRARKTEIYSKLVELGYDAADFPYEWDMEWSSLVHQPRTLTPRIWDTILPKLKARILQRQAERESHERRHRKSQRMGELYKYLEPFVCSPERTTAPLFFTLDVLMTLPVSKRLIGENDFGNKITEEAWISAKDQLEKDMDDFYNYIRKEAKGLIASTREPNTSTRADDGDNKGLAMDSSLDAENDYIRVCKLAQEAIAPIRNSTETDEASEAMTSSSLNVVEDAYLFSPTTLFRCATCKEGVEFRWMLTHTHYRHFMDNEGGLSAKYAFSPQMTAIAEATSVRNPLLMSKEYYSRRK